MFLLISGWVIVLSSMALLDRGGAQAGFVAAGGALEIGGLVMLSRAHAGGPR